MVGKLQFNLYDNVVKVISPFNLIPLTIYSVYTEPLRTCKNNLNTRLPRVNDLAPEKILKYFTKIGIKCKKNFSKSTRNQTNKQRYIYILPIDAGSRLQKILWFHSFDLFICEISKHHVPKYIMFSVISDNVLSITINVILWAKPLIGLHVYVPPSLNVTAATVKWLIIALGSIFVSMLIPPRDDWKDEC